MQKFGHRVTVVLYALVFRDVKVEDEDCYLCQINTEQMKRQVGCVKVLVPPDIRKSLKDVTVTEGGNASLSCEADGQPEYEHHRGGHDEPDQRHVLAGQPSPGSGRTGRV